MMTPPGQVEDIEDLVDATLPVLDAPLGLVERELHRLRKNVEQDRPVTEIGNRIHHHRVWA